MAHRGHRSAFPEQTMPAFRAAIELGATAIEADLQMTRDGRLVMMHDLTLDRTTDGAGPVSARTWDEISRLDAGSWFDPAFAGCRVPLAEELLDLALETDTTLCLEVKGNPTTAPDTATALAYLLRARAVVDRVFMSSFDHEALLAAQTVVDDLLLAPERLPDGAEPDPDEAVRQARRLRATALQHRWEHLTPAVVEALHAAGIAVWAWPTDTEESIEACIGLGVDAVIGDDVAWLLATVAGGPSREPATAAGP
jgi:glycerophosphoryl diester phosphodiesterase